MALSSHHQYRHHTIPTPLCKTNWSFVKSQDNIIDTKHCHILRFELVVLLVTEIKVA